MSTFTGDSRIGTELMYPNRKPTMPVKINWEHPLAKECKYFILPKAKAVNCLASGLMFNSVNHYPVGDSVVSGASADGYKSVGLKMLPNLASAEFSCSFHVDIRDLGNNVALCGQYDGSVSGNRTILWLAGGRLGVFDGATNYLSSILTSPVAGILTITRKGTIWTGYVNGVNTGNIARAANINIGNDTSIFSENGLPQAITSRYKSFMYHDRCLSDVEAAELSNNFYQFLVPDIGA